MARNSSGTPHRPGSEIAERLQRLRTLFGPTQTEFCRRYHFSKTQWSNYEAGFPPSLAAARQLKARIEGLTLDWIYDGDTGGLTVNMARRLARPLKRMPKSS
jgi:transcriptional regulator with XRE-family HTH domain